MKQLKILGRPLKGRNIRRCSGAISLHLHYRVLSGINRLQINETGFETGFQSKLLKKSRTLQLKPVPDSWTGSETGVYHKVLRNVTSAKWRRNILGCSDPWEGNPILENLQVLYIQKCLPSIIYMKILTFLSFLRIYYFTHYSFLYSFTQNGSFS